MSDASPQAFTGMDDIDDFGDEFPSSPSPSQAPSTPITPQSPLTPLTDTRIFRHKCAKLTFVFMTEDQKKTDWYAVLNVQRNASMGTIKEAYHKQCLETHPDKLKTECDSNFKQVVKAFDILGNAELRRAYDSIGPIDEISIKDKTYTEDEFFRVFKRQFSKFAKYSSMAVPELGDMNTNMKEVDAFYNFWYEFKSWRDFSFKMEDVEMEADIPREEKRYIYLQCEREMGKLKRAEAKSIMSLAEKARKNDPRIKLRAQQKMAARNEKILSKKVASVSISEKNMKPSSTAEEPVPNSTPTAKSSENEEKKKNRELKRVVFQLMRELQIVVKTPSMELKSSSISDQNLDWLFQNIKEKSNLLSMIENLKSNPQHLIEALNSEIVDAERRLCRDRYGKPVAAQKSVEQHESHLCKPTASDKWDENSLVELQKAIIAYPRGTVDRWNKIAEYLKQKFTADEVLSKTKEIEKHWEIVKDSTQKNVQLDSHMPEKGGHSWTLDQQKQLEEALRLYRDNTDSDKWAKVASLVEHKSENECQERYKFLCKMYKS